MEAKLGIAVFAVLCLSWQVGAQSVNCTAPGRFADPTDTTCQNYTLCVLNTTSATYVSYNYVCPTTSVFNPNSAMCTDPANYVCNVTAAPVCTADGFVADPTSTTCDSYIQCVQINGTFTQTTLTCPPNTFYDPTTTFCDPTYVCPTANPPAAFSCTTVGRFANTVDTTCQTYFLCALATNGTFVQYQYTCPTTSVFSPTSGLCTSNYVCPTANTTVAG